MTTELEQTVLDFVHAVRASPAMGSDPAALESLSEAARRAAGGMFRARVAPVQPNFIPFELASLMLSQNETSERVPLDLPWPCIIVGAYTSIEPVGTRPEGLIPPRVDSLDVSLDLNIKSYVTQLAGTTTRTLSSPFIHREENFSTLASLSILFAGRDLGWTIPIEKAQIGATFRWKQGANVYQSSAVRITLFARALRKRNRSNTERGESTWR
jgi:hypothetical protein